MTNLHQQENLLSSVTEGMEVRDAFSQSLGKVADIYFGGAPGTTQPTEVEKEENAIGANSTKMGALASMGAGIVLSGVPWGGSFENTLPDQTRNRLLQEGFIRVDGGGILGPVWYVTPGQIAMVTDEGVKLNVGRDEIIRSR